jgi:hypothetical protein
MEPRGVERSVVVFYVHQREDRKHMNYGERGIHLMRINLRAKLLLNQKNYILKAKIITAVETDKIKENIRQNMERQKITQMG